MTTHDAPGVRDNRTLTLVTALVDRGLVAAADRAEALAVIDSTLAGQQTTAPLRRRFAELAGYLGGALVLAAAGIFLASEWETLSVGAQVGLLAGTALVLVVAGFAVAAAGAGAEAMRAGVEPVRRRLTGVLVTGAAAAAGAAVSVFVGDRVTDLEPTAVLAGFATFLPLALAGYLLAPTVIGQLTSAVAAFMLVPLAMDQVGDVEETAFGLIVLGIGLAWLVLAEQRVWREIASARAIGATLAVVGSQIPVAGEHAWVGYLATALVGLAAFGLYVARPAWPFLAAGVASVTLVVPEALIDWTDNALGPAGALLAAGVALIVASLAGFRLRQEVSDEADTVEQS